MGFSTFLSQLCVTSTFICSVICAYCNDGQDSNREKSQDAAFTSKKITSFRESVEAALKNSPSYAVSKKERAIARLNKINAASGFIPNIELTASAKRTGSNQSYDINGSENDSNTSQITAGLAISQNLFNGFASLNNVKGRDAAAVAAQWKLVSDKSDIIYSVFESMVNLWYAKEDYKSADMKKTNLRKELDAQKNSLKAGASTKYDVAKAESNYEQAVYEADLAKLSIRSAEAEYTRLTGLVPTENVELPDISVDMPNSLHELEITALNHNPGILQAKFSEKAAEYDLRVAKGRLLPKVDLTLNGGRNRYVVDSMQSNSRDQSCSIGINLTVPIISSSESGGNSFVNISIASETAKRAGFHVKDTINAVKKECSVNYDNYRIASSMIKAAESAVKSAKIGADGDRQESELGLKSNTDVIVRENQMYDSRKSLARSIAQSRLAKASMLRLMGRLNEKLLGISDRICND